MLELKAKKEGASGGAGRKVAAGTGATVSTEP